MKGAFTEASSLLYSEGWYSLYSGNQPALWPPELSSHLSHPRTFKHFLICLLQSSWKPPGAVLFSTVVENQNAAHGFGCGSWSWTKEYIGPQ